MLSQAIGDVVQAEAKYRRAVEIAPEHAAARLNLAGMLLRRWSIFRSGEPNPSDCSMPIRGHAAAWTLLALVEQMRGASDASIRSLERAFSSIQARCTTASYCCAASMLVIRRRSRSWQSIANGAHFMRTTFGQ